MLHAALVAVALVFEFLRREYRRSRARAELLFFYNDLVNLFCHHAQAFLYNLHNQSSKQRKSCESGR